MVSAVTSSSDGLHSMLQAAVQNVQWTYTIFWQLSPEKGILEWRDGYYNGAIKTRKTVQPTEVSTEEASLNRSEQLKELYESLSSGEPNHNSQRPSAALSPEDLTESEWFYLMCISFSFPPGVGFPGKAYAKRRHVWLTGANEVDSKVFSRAILAKSARIQTVMCIPLLEGVVELGTTQKVKEDTRLIQRIESFFVDHQTPNSPRPALSEHSSSNPLIFCEPGSHSQLLPSNLVLPNPTNENEVEEEEEEDKDEDELDSYGEPIMNTLFRHQHIETSNHETTRPPSELMQLDIYDDIRLGSPYGGSNHLDSDFNLLTMCHQFGKSTEHQFQERLLGVQSMRQLTPKEPTTANNPLTSNDHQPLHQGFPTFDVLSPDDTHYSQTVTTILENQPNQCSNPTTPTLFSATSAFSKWSTATSYSSTDPHRCRLDGTSQSTLKYILFTVTYIHDKSCDPSIRKGSPQDELSANHVLAERRRREKLNERFIILRSLVPFVTKMDKASILGDTIEYVKQLLRKIQELEARARELEAENVKNLKRQKCGAIKRKMRTVEGSVGGQPGLAAGEAGQVEVSIIERDALVEIQCVNKEGLLMDVMDVLGKFRMEVTAVQSSVNDGVLAAEMRAKVKENVNGRKASIVEVKRAINQTILNG